MKRASLNREEVIKKLNEELPVLRKRYGVVRIGFFGSFSRENATADSDIDFVVEYEGDSGLTFVELADYLERVFQRKVDLLTPGGIESIRRKDVREDIEKSIVYV